MLSVILLKNLIDSNGGLFVVPFITAKALNNLFSNKMRGLTEFHVNYFGLLSQLEEIPKNISPVPLKELPAGIDEILPGRIDERIGFIDRSKYLFLKLFSTRPTQFYYLFLKYIYDSKYFKRHLSKYFRKDYHAFLYLVNDLNLGLIIPFFARRILVTRVNGVTGEESLRGIKDMQKVRIVDLLLSVNKNRFFDIPLKAAAIRIEKYINHFLFPLYHSAKEIADTYIRKSRAIEKSFFLTNSLGDPSEALFSRFFHNADIPVITFGHGVIGLLEIYKHYKHFLMSMMHSDAYVCYSEYEREFYRSLTGDIKLKIYIQGVQKELSAPSPKIAQKVCRSIWKIKKEKKTLIYAPTRFQDGKVFPCAVYDMKYWFFIKDLIYDVIGKSEVKCIIKMHQKGLWSLEQAKIYQNRKNPFVEIEMPGNVSTRNYPQLNYSRFAADILMIDHATSTIGWALAADVPLVYLSLPLSPLVPKVLDEMSRAAFVVDVSEDRWKEVLRNILDMSVKELKDAWKEKKECRMKFKEKFVLGPRKGKEGLTDWILGVNAK